MLSAKQENYVYTV